ncbi:MAG: formylglycine-generating enzyme family protein [Pseudanabaena sp. M34BS1SP1A06MG]|nr:formylglycine-generating enzyme family protein [Pseudanabaena sp. M34BS1SP1A06MG]
MDISTENAALIERGLYQIETFLMRFGNDYQALLDYAAIPVVVTPELLNYLRMEFTPKLPWVAEVDLLLSDLFRVVGYEQYAMQSYVRAVLLDGLDARIGKGRMEAAAKLLIGYVAQLKQENPYLSDRELQRQRWSAMVFIDDRKADVANEISNELDQSFVDGKPQDDLLGLVTIAEQLSPQLREFPQLINNARTIGGILRDRQLTKAQKESSINRQIGAVTQPFPTIQEFEFEVAAIEVVKQEEQVAEEAIEIEHPWNLRDYIPEIPAIQLEPFSYQVAKIRIGETQERKGIFGVGAKPKQKKIDIIKTDKQGRQFVERIGKKVNLEMVYVPNGDFVMGAAKDEEDSLDNERPQHLVNVPAFLMGKYPITQAQYEAVMGSNPSRFKDKPDSTSRPVENVSWEDAQAFCKKLSELTGREYRLPSEAQWEYACRAGTTTPFHFGETISTKVANYNGEYVYGMGEKGEYRKQTTPVNYFGVANEFGLCDMHGNVWEWCEDDWHGKYEGAPTDGSAWIDAKNKESNKTSYPLRGGSETVK